MTVASPPSEPSSSSSSRRPAPSSAEPSHSAFRSLLVGGLHELEGHAIALADGRPLGVVLVAEAERRRERPDPFRIILGVFRVRVDLGLRDQLEAGAFDALDEPFLDDVALLR